LESIQERIDPKEVSFDIFVSKFLWEGLVLTIYPYSIEYCFVLESCDGSCENKTNFINFIGAPDINLNLNKDYKFKRYYIDNFEKVDHNNYSINLRLIEKYDKLDNNDIGNIIIGQNDYTIFNNSEAVEINKCFITKYNKNYILTKKVGRLKVDDYDTKNFNSKKINLLIEVVNKLNSIFNNIFYITPFDKKNIRLDEHTQYFEKLSENMPLELYIYLELNVSIKTAKLTNEIDSALNLISDINNLITLSKVFEKLEKNTKEILSNFLQKALTEFQNMAIIFNKIEYQDTYGNVGNYDFKLTNSWDDWDYDESYRQENRISLMQDGILDEDGEWTGYDY